MSSPTLVAVRITSKPHASPRMRGADAAPLSSRLLIPVVSNMILGSTAFLLILTLLAPLFFRARRMLPPLGESDLITVLLVEENPAAESFEFLGSPFSPPRAAHMAAAAPHCAFIEFLPEDFCESARPCRQASLP
jgi:hypothetical protein